MKAERTVKAQLAKVRRYYQGRNVPATWRQAFDEGALQALNWVLGKATEPSYGFEIRLSNKAKAKSREQR